MFFRALGGSNSTGLKDDVYDAVVMLGGFSPGNIAPTGFSEILRITKPGTWGGGSMHASKHPKMLKFI